jgi:hypothetical protein
LRGAATSGNAGGTGGSTTNTHTIAHTHSTSHGHSGNSGNTQFVSPYTGEDLLSATDSALVFAAESHYHAITLNSQSVTSGSNSSIGSQSETVEPAYRTLNNFVNDGASSLMPKVGDIAMYLGSVDDVPVGWVLCDGSDGTPDMQDKFLKVNATATTSTTGGSNTHTHAAEGHTHTIGSHTHTGSVGNASPKYAVRGNGQAPFYAMNDGTVTWHTLSSIGSNSSSLATGTTTAASSDNQPEYVTVAYIQHKYSAVGGCVLFGLI